MLTTRKRSSSGAVVCATKAHADHDGLTLDARARRRSYTLTAKNLRRLRRASRMSRRSVARRLGVRASLIKRYEECRAMVPAGHRKALADLFGVTQVHLMGWDS
jgi:ribosome-binding protein aMBF1 (putative translation factor)